MVNAGIKKRQVDISWALQASYLALYEAGVSCALFQKGHTNLTLGLLAAGPVLMLLSRIPRKWFLPIFRQLLQLALAALGIAWFQHRSVDTPLDVALVECAAIITSSLFLGCRLREHSMMAILCIAFAGYGGLTPGRKMYFPAFIAVIAISTVILYQTRTLSLTRMGNPIPTRMPHYFGNWLYRTLHFLMVGGLCIFFLTQFPIRDRMRTKGLAPVSFRTEQDLEFPELWRDWFTPTRQLLTREKVDNTTDGTSEPSLSSKNSLAFVQDTSLKPLDAREGKGGSALGDELLFRVYTPAKLYWVMQIYDTYDGNVWTRSPSLIKGSNALDSFEPEESYEIVQSFSINKAISLRVPYAYRPVQAMLRDKSTNSQNQLPAMIIRSDAVSFTMKSRSIPDTPWNYRVQSFVPAPELKASPRPWNEPPRNFGWNYRSLPQKYITQRLRKLALDLCAGHDSAMDKANAIRNYLRDTYKYTLEFEGVPKDRECVDYFLFDSREGCCQQFAQAMVVLSRLAGLHSRLVTGFSPGKFNVLANLFEVYEYHAHAWAQVFIEPYGWLTFDAVPPGEMSRQDKSGILSAMLDPFGDNWSENPPELSYHPPKAKQPQQTAKKDSSSASSKNKKHIKEETRSKSDKLIDEIYDKAVADNKNHEPDAAQLLKAAFQIFTKRLKDAMTDSMAATRAKVVIWLNKAWNACLNILNWLKSRTIADFILYGGLIACLLFLYNSHHRIVLFIKRQCLLFKCFLLWRKVKSGQLGFAHTITACQNINNQLLELADFKRPLSSDIFERTAFFPKTAAKLMPDYIAVATAAFDSWYGINPPDKFITDSAVAATASFRHLVRPFLSRKWKKAARRTAK